MYILLRSLSRPQQNRGIRRQKALSRRYLLPSPGLPCSLNSTIHNYAFRTPLFRTDHHSAPLRSTEQRRAENDPQAGSVNTPAGSWPGPGDSLGAPQLTDGQRPRPTRERMRLAFTAAAIPAACSDEKIPRRPNAPGPSAPPWPAQAFSAGAASACPTRRATQKPRSGSENSGPARAPEDRNAERPHSGLPRAVRSAGPGSRRRRNAERSA